MPEPTAYLGAVRNGPANEPHSWSMTNDHKRLLDADDEEVIWADDVHAVAAILQMRYPEPAHPKFAHVVPNAWGVNVQPVAKVLTKDNEELAALTKQFGKIETWDYVSAHSFDWAAHGIVFDGGKTLVYDPKEVKRRRNKIEQRVQKTQVTLDELRSCLYAFQRALCYNDKGKRKGWSATAFNGCVDRGTTISILLGAIAIFNLTFGKQHGRSAYKKFGAFQKLVRKWRERRVPSNKVYRENGQEDFADFMDKLANGRLPKEVPATEFVLPDGILV